MVHLLLIGNTLSPRFCAARGCGGVWHGEARVQGSLGATNGGWSQLFLYLDPGWVCLDLKEKEGPLPVVG